MAWRMTEEFTEATECMEDNREHYLEEMVDALHFFVELCLHADFYPSVGMNEIPKPNYFLEPYDVIEQVGLACNCLKNKPWKQTHMLTDIPKFRGCLNSAWVVFIQIFLMEGLEPVDIYNLYFRKNAVNQFRQRSKY
jgi:dimeric dUTPase (all-alpha-NTP-PPase superfamily)